MNKITTLSLGLIIVLSITMLLNSCSKDEVNESPITTTYIDPSDIVFPNPTEIIQTCIYGRVSDVNDQPIVGAIITCESCQTSQFIESDSTGNFLFEEIQNKGQSAYLTIEKQGNFKSFRRMGILANKFNYTEIHLNEKKSIGQLTSEDGGTVQHISGASVTLPANGVVDQSGNNFNGTYEVYAAWINPDSENLSQNLIGDLSGFGNDGRLMSLSTFGMLVIELLDGNGNELNLAEGQEAELKFQYLKTC